MHTIRFPTTLAAVISAPAQIAVAPKMPVIATAVASQPAAWNQLNAAVNKLQLNA